MKNLQKKITELMTENPQCVKPNVNMIEIENIFKRNNFHHIPVIDDNDEPIGIISKSDYHMLLHHFTKKKIGNFDVSNRMFFRSLLATDVMTPDPLCVKIDGTIEQVVDEFLKNEFRSLIVVDENNICQGIVTPFDIIKWLKIQNSKMAEELIW